MQENTTAVYQPWANYMVAAPQVVWVQTGRLGTSWCIPTAGSMCFSFRELSDAFQELGRFHLTQGATPDKLKNA